jgi:hypothetical protein
VAAPGFIPGAQWSLCGSTWVHLWCLVESVWLIFLVFCVVFLCFVFVLRLVFPMLPVSLDCPFVISPSVFSNIYLFLRSRLFRLGVMLGLSSELSALNDITPNGMLDITISPKKTNRLDGIMIIAFSSSTVDCGLELRSSQT